ncbi:DUF192 domain-containing protein [Sandarakinorhabdus sp.]|uniref:DUF192 domain-containing protein n=1 Tax=Sandarakinorhabdus sp. TaxID=1916663 RepID=UPI00286E53D0|nr:DUF192 domain-containing protein [Sandarakinorhabdus sp.]
MKNPVRAPVALAMLAACTFGAASPAMAACPSVGLRLGKAVFQTAKGKFSYRVEVAASPADQECGLMFRKAMRRDSGMIFPFVPPRTATFWMENTELPLDLIFYSSGGRVISIGRGKPFTRELIPSGGVAAGVIELNLGEAQRIGLQPGDRVRY